MFESASASTGNGISVHRIDDCPRLTWDYATSADIDDYYGERPHETLRAIVVKLNGMPAGLLGLAKEADRDRAFTEYKPELEPYLKSIVVGRAIQALLKWVKASRVPVYALSDRDDVLTKYGFKHIQGEYYEWPG
jgi:hypothetical protein